MDITLRRPRDLDELDRLIRCTANAKQRDRYRAVRLAIDGEMTADIQHTVGRSRGFVQRWCYAYRDHGLDAVGPIRQTGRPTNLPPDQHPAFKQRVLDGPTGDDGVCAFRGRDMQRILEREFGASYTISGVYELLDRLGLVVLSPRPQHRKSDPEAMQRWVERAPPLSTKSAPNTPANASRCGSRTRHASGNKAR
ncbi:MAG: winged helix-turn-helix domain-containing protein [Phycisphaerales bacterium]|nr:winged helix-turn-helix domain-containing protein [Phycisphaerales bacterium]